MSRSLRHCGFTLVELLVVIGIIALLISILLPSLNRARKAAQEVQCMSNMRQLGLAISSYANNYQQTIPLLRPSWIIVPYVSTNITWAHLLLEGQYLSTDSVLYCPDHQLYEANHPTVTNREYSTYWGYYSYGMSLACFYDWAINNYRVTKLTDIRGPAEKILLVEATNAETTNYGCYMAYPWYTADPGIAWPRHGDREKANVLWADGHVTSVRNETPRIPSGIYGQGALTTMNSTPDYWRIR